MKGFSTLLIEKCKSKAQSDVTSKVTIRCYFLMTIIKKSTNKNVGEGVEKREPSYTRSDNANCCNHQGKWYGSS